ncbi:MAG: hypothetical protein ACREHG_05760 [Candidatus Saccharimonadales bacterium]
MSLDERLVERAFFATVGDRLPQNPSEAVEAIRARDVIFQASQEQLLVLIQSRIRQRKLKRIRERNPQSVVH